MTKEIIVAEMTTGGVNEGDGWTLIKDYDAGMLNKAWKPCKHSTGVMERTRTRHDKSTWVERYCVYPLVASNFCQAGFDSASICAECVYEKVAELKGVAV